ncbi:MAG: hypothetical protein U9Q74_01420 [Gemmatimonadota bacterium]|nr:hypothetical protein [Gemmatimonadota bacterium]
MLTRPQALAKLGSPADLSFDDVDDVFRAFGFDSASPTFEIQVYYHPKHRCGAFTARDDGLHLVTPMQREVVRGMIECVLLHERLYP